MTGAQAAGAGTGAVLGGILSESLQHFAGYTIDPVSATAIVVALGAAFGAIFHGIDKYGLRGISLRIWRGAPTPPAATPLEPAPQTAELPAGVTAVRVAAPPPPVAT